MGKCVGKSKQVAPIQPTPIQSSSIEFPTDLPSFKKLSAIDQEKFLGSEIWLEADKAEAYLNFTRIINEASAEEFVPDEVFLGVRESRNPADKLFDNLVNFLDSRFKYTGATGTAQSGFIKMQGDCSTLVNMYIYAAKHFEIDVKMNIWTGERLVGTANILGRSTKGNTSGKLFWFFGEHYWAESDGRVYDMLFKTKELVRSYPRVLSAEEIRNKVTIKAYENSHYSVGPSNLLRDIDPETIHVFENISEARKFIDENSN